jgi:hypothetical protein
MNFDFKNAKENEKRSFVGYGINNDVTIISVESGASQTGTPFIQVNLKNTGDEDTNATIQKMYITDKSKGITMGKIMHIHSAISKIDAIRAQNFSTLEDMAAGLNKLWSGKRLRLKLQASEYEGVDEDGMPKTKIRTELPMRDFAEAIVKGGEMFVITDDKTQLKWDKKNKWDYKRLKPETDDSAPPTPNMDMGTDGGTDVDDAAGNLPF